MRLTDQASNTTTAATWATSRLSSRVQLLETIWLLELILQCRSAPVSEDWLAYVCSILRYSRGITRVLQAIGLRGEGRDITVVEKSRLLRETGAGISCAGTHEDQELMLMNWRSSSVHQSPAQRFQVRIASQCCSRMLSD